MRYVKKDLADVPKCLTKPEVLKQLNEIAQGNIGLIDDKVYKGTYLEDGKTKSKVRDHLNKFYFKKCAYCESLCKAEIEHYRPKKGITGISKEKHKGYYWLCYEWSNLVPSCRYCNTEGGKGNKFPVANSHVSLPKLKNNKLDYQKNIAAKKPLIDEAPQLLHPEIDDPKLYLRFKIGDDDTIELEGIDKNERGADTICICNLNRDDLSLARYQTVLWNMRQTINTVFKNNKNGLIEDADLAKALFVCFDEFKNALNDTELEYTLLRWYVVEDESNFNKLLIPLLEKGQKEVVCSAFKSYLKNL